MKCIKERFIQVLALLCLPVFFAGLAQAAEKTPASAFSDLENSAAFAKYRQRPFTEQSKLLCLIDRFALPSVEILYEGHYFKAPFAARVVRWYLNAHYNGETARHWILKKCYRSHQAGVIIWAKLPSGEFRMARDILLDELEKLERLTEELERMKATSSEVEKIQPAAAGPSDAQEVSQLLTPVVAVAAKT